MFNFGGRGRGEGGGGRGGELRNNHSSVQSFVMNQILSNLVLFG